MLNHPLRVLPALLLLLMSSQGLAQVVESNTFETTFQKMVIRSVVKIHNKNDFRTGSGFVVGRDSRERIYVMTCAHVADIGPGLQLDFHPHGSIDVHDGVEIVARDQRRDMAVLRIAPGIKAPPVVLGANRPVPDGRFETLVVGFPDGNRTTRIVTSDVRRSEAGRENLYLSDRIGPGASGSPVIVRRGEHHYTVVGIYWGHTSNNGLATVGIGDFLKENSLDFLQEDLTEDELNSFITAALQVLVEELADR
jgi:S1-C subfamily serine protease